MSPENFENDNGVPDNAIKASQASETNVPTELKSTENDNATPDRVTVTGEGDLSPPPAIKIEPESPADKINVGAGGRLIIEREDMDALLDDGEDLDDIAPASMKICKPNRRHWFMLNKKSEICLRLLQDKPDDLKTEYYYLAPSLRNRVRDELTLCRVFVCYSINRKIHFLWIVHAHPGLSWYESIQPLLAQSEEFFVANRVRVWSSKDDSQYHFKKKPLPVSVAWPDKTTEELLAEALGEEHFITNADHPLYQDLVDGEEVK